jgi:alpha-glucosidase (family GH31 glycosyl hydrolase)
MQRRTFLKKSAIGLGAVAGFCGGVLKAQAVNSDQHSVETAQSNGNDFVEIEEECRVAWGTNAVVLKSPWSRPPAADEMLADNEHTLALNQFYRVGGEDRRATPTECRVAYSSDALLILFRCEESDMSFPYANLDKNLWPVDWYSLHGLPSANNNWPPNPDEVDFLIQPDTGIASYYQFAATPQGLKFGCNRLLVSNTDASADQAATARDSSVRANMVETFEASVTRRADEWLAYFKIPWQTLGGKPKSHFGFLPMRTRWRDGEFSSPVAIDLNECLPIDLLIETHISDTARIRDSQDSLCELPSGVLRWQRPAVLTYPDIETQRQIWQMQSSLPAPTDEKKLAQRLFLTQRWMDLMMQEGFTPLPRAWGDLTVDLTLAFFRQKVNALLQKDDLERACHLLDTYLSQLDKMSRWWYADGSPGDILKGEWKPVTSAEGLEVQGNTLLMRCAAGVHRVDLRLALPTTGGVRIYGPNEGYWRPADLLPLSVRRTSTSCSIETADGRIVIRQRPFSISFYDAVGNEVTQIGAMNLAFRFSSDGQILAIDYRNHLDAKEVIYGFGEKYDRFNQNGNVLTLWGTDDWVGNGVGGANTTYKPLPIFHSSKGYMVFDNSSYRLRADIGKTEPIQYRLTQHGPIFDFYFWIGSPEKRLQSYTALTGTPPLPPKWVFEPWMGRGEGAWASGPLHDPVQEEESVVKRFAELDIPHSAIYAEGASALSPALNQFMAERGIRVLGYFYPVMPLVRQQPLMPELKQSELPYLHFANGDVAPDHDHAYIDFTNPRALELCRRALSEALDLGEAGSMVDYGDMVPDDAVFYDGRHGAEMHNSYYYDYQRTVSEIFQEKRGNDFILYARGAAPGTQRWVGQFAGDHPANFNGLRHVVTGALNLCACGYSNWGSDLGGYFGFPQPAVYMRWFQFGCFSPLMRPHGTAPRDPWYFGEPAVTNYKFLAWTRENLLNYTYNAAAIAHETGVSIMRSMPVAFPHERQMAAVSDQYMFGPDLLVAPVVNEDAFRTVVFPPGVWTSLWDGRSVYGPATLKVDAPLDTIPVYLKPGAFVPVQLNRELQFGKSMTRSRFDALVVTPPIEDRKTTMLNARGEVAKVAVQSKAGGCGWSLENFPEMSYVLVYGTPAATNVKVDGRVLPNVTNAGSGSIPIGWKVDPAGNRLVIRLPSRHVEHSERTTEIEVDFSPSNNGTTKAMSKSQTCSGKKVEVTIPLKQRTRS